MGASGRPNLTPSSMKKDVQYIPKERWNAEPAKDELFPKPSRPALVLDIYRHVSDRHASDGPRHQLTVCVLLGQMSETAQKRWRQHLKLNADDPRKSVRTWFRLAEMRSPAERAEDRKQLLEEHPEFKALEGDYQFLRGDDTGGRVIWINKLTTVDHVVIQLLAYLLQEELVQWEEIAAYARDYFRQYQEITLDINLHKLLWKLALPHEANALRPVDHSAPEATFTVAEAARELGLSKRQLRYMIHKGEVHIIPRGRRQYISHAELQRLREELEPVQEEKDHRKKCFRIGRSLDMSDAAIKQTIKRGRKQRRSWPEIGAIIERNAKKKQA